MHLRRALPSDADCLYTWRTDPDTVAASLAPPPPNVRAHEWWLNACLTDPTITIWIAEEKGEPIGTVRFDANLSGTATINVTVAPKHRGKGWGSRLIRVATLRYLEEADVEVIRAHVKPDNKASLRAFRAAGYTRNILGRKSVVTFRYAKEE